MVPEGTSYEQTTVDVVARSLYAHCVPHQMNFGCFELDRHGLADLAPNLGGGTTACLLWIHSITRFCFGLPAFAGFCAGSCGLDRPAFQRQAKCAAEGGIVACAILMTRTKDCNFNHLTDSATAPILTTRKCSQPRDFVHTQASRQDAATVDY